MTGPIVTVCIVTFNQRAFIGECIRSVLEQQAQARLRILVGDDASDDGTSDIVAQLSAEHPETITHLRQVARSGAFVNMRNLIVRADGEFIARTDGDDYWLPGKLQRQIQYLQAHGDCAAVYTNAITVDEAGHRIGLFNDVGDARFDLGALLRRGNFLNNSSVLFRMSGRQAWLDVETPQIDYRVHLWHARHGYLAHLGAPLTAYRVNLGGSATTAMNDKVRELYWEAIQSVPRELVGDADYAHGIADFMRRVCFRALSTRNRHLLHEWWPRVRAASPYGSLHTAALVIASILRIGGKTLGGCFRRGPDGRPLRILYRR
ncbi:MAG TPA: glycosyltransferase [Rhodanobacteraceae bacterium]|nr:glycosyltransferase [Rhodanobacteraceae bacterium]